MSDDSDHFVGNIWRAEVTMINAAGIEQVGDEAAEVAATKRFVHKLARA